MKRFTRYARSRWICLPTLAKILFSLSIVLSASAAIINPGMWWGVVESVLIMGLVAEVNYMHLRHRFNQPAVKLAEILGLFITTHDEIIIYKADGEVRFIGITNETEEEEASASH